MPQAAVGIDSPGASDEIYAPTAVLKGTATPGAEVEIQLDNGDSASTKANTDGNWHKRISLSMGDNGIVASSTKPGYSISDKATVTVTRKESATQIAAEKAARAAREAQRKQDFINKAQVIPYAQLIKDTTPYEGKPIHLHGQIFQIQQQQGMGGIMLLSVTDEGYGLWTDQVWVDYSHDIPYAEKDMVDLWATVTGTKTYDTQSGGSRYVPEVEAKYILGG
jgi:hypothetical protein